MNSTTLFPASKDKTEKRIGFINSNRIEETVIRSNDEIYAKLFTYFRRITDIPEDEAEHFMKNTSVDHYKKNDFFVRQGEIPQKLGFIVEGLMRKFYLDKDGKDFTKLFCLENNFTSAFAAFLKQEESYFSVEALEDTTTISLDYNYFNEGIERHICWLKLYNKALEHFYIIKERREGQLLLENAKNRYLQFLRDYPGLENRVKQYHIASYIGITPVSLSRIRMEL